MMNALNPLDVLRLFRERSPLAVNEQAELFLKMSERHRSELLFYMLQHVNMALQQRDGAPTQALEDVARALAGGDA